MRTNLYQGQLTKCCVCTRLWLPKKAGETSKELKLVKLWQVKKANAIEPTRGC